MQNGSNHDYLSNQFLAGLPVGTSNPGGDGFGGNATDLAAINLNDYDGDQFFEITIDPLLLADLTGDGFHAGRVDGPAAGSVGTCCARRARTFDIRPLGRRALLVGIEAPRHLTA